MSQTHNLIVSCLNELNSQNFKDVYESLLNLQTYLEEKNDPDNVDIEIVSAVYEMVEKMKALQDVLKRKVNDIDEKSMGSILKDFYNKDASGNTSALF